MKEKKLINLMEGVPEIMETLNACHAYALPNFYLAGGAITQIIWNELLQKPHLDKVKDFDIIYFSKNEKNTHAQFHKSEIQKMVSHSVALDVVNQAFVHEWYGSKYGNEINPFTQTEDGIKTWLPAFAIGITKLEKLEVYAPYGLEDAFNLIVRPNKLSMNENSYLKMTKSFKNRWNEIEIIPWDSNN